MVSTLHLEFVRDVAVTAIWHPVSILPFYFSNQVLLLFRLAVCPTEVIFSGLPCSIAM